MQYQNKKSRSTDFICQTLTYSGDALMVKALAGDATLKFTKFKIGNGKQQAEATLKDLTDLINPLMEVSIKSIERNQNNVVLNSNNYFNSDITEDIHWNELGVYAEDPDDGEVLFAVLNYPDLIEYIPAVTNGISIENEFAVMLLISSDVEVSAVIKSIQYVTKDELEEHMYNTDNPHNVTATDVGLENVKNVLFSENEVDFETGQKLVNFNVKDTLKSIISVCWSAVDRLIKHIDPKQTNPHKTTYEDIKSDSGWQEIVIDISSKKYFTNKPVVYAPMQYRKLNGVVYLTGGIFVGSSYDHTSRRVTTLPNGFKPDKGSGTMIIRAYTTLGDTAQFRLYENGELYLYKLDTGINGAGGVGFNISFLAK